MANDNIEMLDKKQNIVCHCGNVSVRKNTFLEKCVFIS